MADYRDEYKAKLIADRRINDYHIELYCAFRRHLRGNRPALAALTMFGNSLFGEVITTKLNESQDLLPLWGKALNEKQLLEWQLRDLKVNRVDDSN